MPCWEGCREARRGEGGRAGGGRGGGGGGGGGGGRQGIAPLACPADRLRDRSATASGRAVWKPVANMLWRPAKHVVDTPCIAQQSVVSASMFQLSHSVETNSSHGFAWAFMTNVRNWDDPPARFELDGPFAAGSRGTTLIPGQEPRHWRIREVHPCLSYVIETDLEGAALSFEWRFEAISETRTRLTQRIELSGEAAAKHATAVEAGFGSSLAPGMERIARVIAAAYSGGDQIG